MKTLFSSILIACTCLGWTQDKIGMDINMTYSRAADNTVSLVAEVYDEEDYEAVMDLEFYFHSMMDDEEILLGTAFSDEEAMVKISGVPFEQILLDGSDNMTFRISAEDDIYSGQSEISVRHVDLSLNFEATDEEKIVSVQLLGKDENGDEKGVEDGEIYFYIPRLYGNLSIGDVWTDEDGYDQMDFPQDIPGDEAGNLTVIARITDSDEFGSIEIRDTISWGIPTTTSAMEDRELWSPNAPAWMVITFAVLMSGVLAHYVWVVINLFRIRNLGS